MYMYVQFRQLFLQKLDCFVNYLPHMLCGWLGCFFVLLSIIMVFWPRFLCDAFNSRPESWNNFDLFITYYNNIIWYLHMSQEKLFFFYLKRKRVQCLFSTGIGEILYSHCTLSCMACCVYFTNAEKCTRSQSHQAVRLNGIIVYAILTKEYSRLK